MDCILENINIPVDASFLIEFDKDVVLNSVNSFFNIVPEVQIKTITDKENSKNITIQFPKKLEWNTVYTLTVKEGIKDKAGNKSEKKEYRFLTNCESSRPLKIKNVYLEIDKYNENVSGRFTEISKDDEYSSLTFPVTIYPTEGSSTSTNLYIIVSASKESLGISEPSVMRALRIYTSNSCMSVTIKKIKSASLYNTMFAEVYPKLSEDGVFENEEPVFYGIKCGIEITNKDNSGFLTFSISGDLSDDLGNTAVGDWIAVCNKQ